MVDAALFLAFLAQHDDQAWLRAVDRLEGAMHPVDRAATRVWFHLFPLRVQRALEEASDPVSLARHLRIEGRWSLAEQREDSHWFLFGHRYWAPVRSAVEVFARRDTPPGSLDLAAQVQEISRECAARLQVPPAWLVGITAVAVRTFQQVGLPPVPASAPAPLIGGAGVQPDRLAARRAHRPGGLFAFLKGGRRQWSVRFDERRDDGSFPLIDSQHLTTAAALDTRDHRVRDARCTEGPIPVHCRSCSCGTCWVGVLDGADRLSPVEPRERTTIAALGYLDSADPQPVIRLACMAQAHGPVTLVIPPWNGQVGARLERVQRGPTD